MYYYNSNDKDDPINFDSNQLFGQSFEDSHNPFLNFEATSHNNSLPSEQQDFLLSQLEDYNITHNGGSSSFNFFDNKEEQAILLSDPNFLRQQQLLLQVEEKTRQHSNLSAMFSKKQDSPQIEPINLITSQQQKKDILNRKNNRKSTTTTIPMSSPLPSADIDHQRRFNELQARFRVNYAKKPTKEDDLSCSFTDTSNNKRKLSLETASKPLIRMNSGKIKVASKSPTTATSGMAIPNSNSNNHHTTSSSLPSSFPSRTMSIQIQRVHRANAFQPFDLEQRQKRLDDQLVKVDFNDITVSELKEMLRQRGKPATGKKAILLSRLQEEKDLILHARANGIPISSRYAIQAQQQQQQQQQDKDVLVQSPIAAAVAASSSSLPDTTCLSRSPNLGSLNRSIADMHIGSPPMTSQQSRRFAPYATSPRSATTMSTATATITNTNQSPFHSSSVPTGNLDIIMQQQQQQQQEPRVMMRGFNFNKKTYAPFASSTLATPDRDDDHNPFDNYKDQEETNQDSPNDMEWTDPTLDFMNNGGLDFNDKSAQELLSFLSSQGFHGDEFTNLNELDNSHNNFQTNGGPDLGSVMFATTDDTNNIIHYQHNF